MVDYRPNFRPNKPRRKAVGTYAASSVPQQEAEGDRPETAPQAGVPETPADAPETPAEAPAKQRNRALPSTPKALAKEALGRWRSKVRKESGAKILAECEKWIAQEGFGVFLRQTDEAGPMLWAVGVAACPDFWLDAFKTEEKARKHCQKLNWRIVDGLHQKSGLVVGDQ